MLIQVRRALARVTDAPFNADPTGGRDATLAFQQALWEHSIVEVPPGRYRIRHRETLAPTVPGHTIREHVGVIVPGGRRLFGHGSESVILNELDDPTRPELAQDAGLPNAISWFWIDWDVRDVSIEGLRFLGQGPGNLTAETHLTNLQMCCVEWAYDAPHGRAPDHVELRRCTFERQYGFWAHGRHGGNHASILECTAIDCMNGQNVNADHSLFARNLSIRSEGFENSSSHSIFADNRIYDAFIVAMAIGGNTGAGNVRDEAGGFTNRDYGNRVLGNILVGARHYALQVTANASDTLVQGNYIERAARYGIFVGSPDPTNVPRHTKLHANSVVDCGAEDSDERAAIAALSFDEVEIDGNTARYGEFTGYRQEYGLLLGDGRGARVDRNRLDGRMYGMSASGTRDLEIGDANDFGPRGTELLRNPTFRRPPRPNGPGGGP